MSNRNYRTLKPISDVRDQVIRAYENLTGSYFLDGAANREDWRRVGDSIEAIRDLAEKLISLAAVSNPGYETEDLPDEIKRSWETAQKYERLILLDAKDKGFEV